MSTIKFSPNQDEKITLFSGSTALSLLPAICAVVEAGEPVRTEKEAFHNYPTDKIGLESLLSACGENLDFLHESIRVISLLVIHADKAEIQDEMDSIHWLQVGLAELANYVKESQVDIQDSLQHHD